MEIISHGREVLLCSIPDTSLVFACVFRLSKGQAGIDIKNVSSRSILTVSNITEDRYGNYTCVAVNKLGTANASVSLIRK
ncbi:hypothetical protein QTP70_027913 [Hemibagrus guttatus]|uniref:Immunoglobulin I-set domain-containing protein n=1 Tax=Hemibagrus guttatus TaxID=175788 RepID=A0AAE0RKQ3_9TELE|nr:hypothetical protein QTP70_027913 [Hemibagrus guttatus]